MTLDLNRALLFADISNVVYDDPSDKADAELAVLGLTKLAHFDHKTSHAVLAQDENGNIILAHRGTMFSEGDIENVLVNFEVGNISYFIGGQVPIGYYDAACRIWAQAYEYIRTNHLMGKRLCITGHSMGGTNATLSAAVACSLGFSPEVWTFGAPKPGDKDFCDLTLLMNLNRFVRAKDFAPTYPLIGNYTQPIPLVWLHDGRFDIVTERPGVNEVVEDHWISEYIADLEKLVGSGASI